MTKKHYIAIARRFAQLRKEALLNEGTESFKAGLLTGLNSAMMEITEAFQVERPEFNRAKFLEACLGVSV